MFVDDGIKRKQLIKTSDC